MWSFVSIASCVLAHVLLVIILLPHFWREIEQRSGWHVPITLFVVPLMGGWLTLSYLLENFSSMPGWQVIVALLTLDALLLVMLISALRLRALRKRRRG